MADTTCKFILGGEISILGKMRKIVLRPTLLNQKLVNLTENEFQLLWPHAVWVDRPDCADEYFDVSKKFLHQLAEEIILHRAEFQIAKTQLIPAKIKIKNVRTRWGSCSSKKKINLNYKLIAFREEIIDLVIIHELCHLKHMDHSKNFWNLVYQFQPHYKTLNRELKISQGHCIYLDQIAAKNNGPTKRPNNRSKPQPPHRSDSVVRSLLESLRELLPI